MKKYFTESPYIRYNKRHARKSSKKAILFKKYKKEKNKLGIGQKKTEKVSNKHINKLPGYKNIKAPNNFTLIGNPEPVLEFIARLKDCFNKKQKVFVVLREVTSMHYDAIIVLLSIMVRFKSQKIPFNGDFPNDLGVRSILRRSGFLETLYKKFKDVDRYDIKRDEDNLIHTHAQKNVDSKLTAKVLEQTSNTVWNETKRCQGVQRTLIELMLNTNNHATVGKAGDKHWWLSVNHRKHENKVCFSFVDYGVGIFTSLENKDEGSRFHGAISKMLSAFKFKDNAELLELILNGELHKTITGEYFRGKGIPGIYEALKRNSFSNLYIITNDVYADISKGDFRKLSTNFNGTFLYWEVNNSNISCDGIN